MKKLGRELKKLVKTVKANYRDADVKLIQDAFFFAEKAHKNQFRESKKPFIIHPFSTALILAELGADPKTVAAALLHDVLEDTKTKPAELQKRFGREVLKLVEGVTKLSRLASEKREAKRTANLQNLLLATTKDPRVIVIKLADKLHNLKTLGYLAEDDRKRIASEALHVYAPIALKLGIHALYNDMSNLSFKHLRPAVYADLSQLIKRKGKIKRAEINAMVQAIRKRIKKKDVSFSIDEKTIYSIHSKMLRKDKSLDELPDFFVLKIVAPSTIECYGILGVIHSLFTPLPKRVRDYIALPQPNLYQALHTTVIGPNGEPVKVRIATKAMQEITKKGIIAYWQFRSRGTDKLLHKNIESLAKVIGRGKMPLKRKDFLVALKADFLAKTIVVFTPDGEAVELVAGATPIDFAFECNKKTVFRLWRAKVNGKFVSLGRKLENGDIVELIASSGPQVKDSWLKYAKGFAVKKAIKQFLQKPVRSGKQKPSIDLNVEAKDRVGILAAISKAISSNGINIGAVAVGRMPNAKAECQFNVEFSNAAKLRKAIEEIKKIKDVKSVEIVYRG